MDVRCERCKTEYEFDDARITEAGVTVKCTTCSHVFRVKKKALVFTVPVKPDELAPAPPPPAPPPPEPRAPPSSPQREWKVRQASGNIFNFKELTTLQKWIVERKVSRDDEISLTGESWKRLGNIAELASFFQVVDEAQKGHQLAALQNHAMLGLGNQAYAGQAPVYPQPAYPTGYPAPSAAPLPLTAPAQPEPQPMQMLPRPPHPAPAQVQEAPPPPPPQPQYAPAPPPQPQYAPAPPPQQPQYAAAPQPQYAQAPAGPGPTALGEGAHAPGRADPAFARPPRAAAELDDAALEAAAFKGKGGGAKSVWILLVLALLGGGGFAGWKYYYLPMQQQQQEAQAAADKARADAQLKAQEEAARAAQEKAAQEMAELERAAQEKAARDAALAAVDAGPVDAGVVAAAEAAPAPKRSFDALMALADRLREREKSAAALDAYGQAADLKPDRAEPVAGRGLALLDMGQLVQAEASFQQALKLNGRYGTAMIGLAEAMRAQGKKAQAIQWYEKYLDALPNGPEAAVAKGAIERLKQ